MPETQCHWSPLGAVTTGTEACTTSRKTPIHANSVAGGASISCGVGRDCVAGRKVFTKEQRAFFAAHAPDGVGLDDLAVLGPIFVLNLKFSPPGYDRRLEAELWLCLDGSRILELSTKCSPTEPFEVAAEASAFLTQRGIDLAREQQTKTRTALEFFASELSSKP